MILYRLFIMAICLVFPVLGLADACGSSFWQAYHGTRLFRLQGTSVYYFMTDHMAVDADGAPNAYHPGDIGLDYLANAGYPNQSWWPDVLVTDPEDSRRAYIQDSGEFKGYFVSKTALTDKAKQETDPARYVDARHVPYLVFPGSYYKMNGTGVLGDIGVAVNFKLERTTPVVVADIGPSEAKLGEVSINLAERLSGNPVNPRTGSGAPPGDTLYILFPYSARQHRWPLSYDEMARLTSQRLERLGGLEKLIDCALAQ
ncbi:MAG: hypothetical protein ACU85E_16950 [Gammaproteobacteria bacterium]